MKFINPLSLINFGSVKIVLRITALVTIVIVAVIVFVFTYRNRKYIVEEKKRFAQEENLIHPDNTLPDIQDFYRNTGDARMGATYPLRQRQSHWSKEEVQFYWINPKDAGLETLSKSNDDKIYEYLELSPP